MFHRSVLFMILAGLLCIFCACQTASSGRWKVRAFDLSGKEIYNGELVQGPSTYGGVSNQLMKTTTGKRVMFHNATLVFEEQ